MLFERLQIPKTTVFVDKGVLIELFFRRFSHQTGTRHIFYINLYPLSGIGHCLVWFGNVFRIGQLDGLSVNPAQELIQSGDRSGVALLPELNPEHHQTRVRIPSTHIPNQRDLRFCMLIRMAVRAVGTVCKGL